MQVLPRPLLLALGLVVASAAGGRAADQPEDRAEAAAVRAEHAAERSEAAASRVDAAVSRLERVLEQWERTQQRARPAPRR
jgi:hypothetical protein